MTDIEQENEDGALKRRVIGTPPPAEQNRLLNGGGDDGGDQKLVHDPDAAKFWERVAALCFVGSAVASVGFVACYTIFQVSSVRSVAHSNLALGLCLSLALLLLSVGVTIWIRRLMVSVPITQDRHEMASDTDVRETVAAEFAAGAEETGIIKRPLLRRTLLLASAPLGIAPLVLLRDLGPLPKTSLRHTAWAPNKRLVVAGTGQPIKATDFDTPGGIITVVPEGTDGDLEVLATSTVLLLNIPPEDYHMSQARMNWTVNGIVAYSKICTHVGCPAALYEQTTHHILCPCHQSTFDATRGAKVIFGPAARPLPQLPLGVNDEGYLIAKRDFVEPVGPSFWERGSVSHT